MSDCLASDSETCLFDQLPQAYRIALFPCAMLSTANDMLECVTLSDEKQARFEFFTPDAKGSKSSKQESYEEEPHERYHDLDWTQRKPMTYSNDFSEATRCKARWR